MPTPSYLDRPYGVLTMIVGTGRSDIGLTTVVANESDPDLTLKVSRKISRFAIGRSNNLM